MSISQTKSPTWVSVNTPLGLTYTTVQVLNTNTGLTNESFYVMGKNIWKPMDLININSDTIQCHGLEINILESTTPPQSIQKINAMQETQKTFLSSMLFTVQEQHDVEANIAEFCVVNNIDFDFWANYLSDTQIIRWATASQDNIMSAQQYLKIFHNDPDAALKIMKNLRNSLVKALHHA